MFLLRKYYVTPYILLFCYRKKTSLSNGKVIAIGDRDMTMLLIDKKKKKPVIETHFFGC
jgi:hypothetical protein